MECPHLTSDFKINRELIKIKKCQLIDKCNTTNNSTSTPLAPTIIDQNHGTLEVTATTTIVTKTATNTATTALSSGSNVNLRFWKCGVDECDSKNNWMCLSCGLTFCGRYEKGHALHHFNTKDHKVCMSIIDFSVYCYKCDNFVVNSTSQLEEIRQYLSTEDDTKSETSSNTEESVSLSGSSIKSLSNNSNASISSNDSGWEEPLLLETGRRLRPRKRTNSNDSSIENNNSNKGRKVQRKSVKDNEINNPNDNSASSTGTITPNKNFRRCVGLRSLGNTCFMNSVLQSLSNIEEFSCYISSLPSLDKEGSNNNSHINVTKHKQRVYHSRSMKENYDDAMVLKDLRRLLIDLGKGTNGKAITPGYLLRWNFPQFNMNEQNDAHEFLRYMLDRLHTELQHLPNNFDVNNSANTSSSTSSNTITKLNSTKDLGNSNGCANSSDSTIKNNSNNSNNTSSGTNVVNCNSSNSNNNYNYRGSKSSIVTNVFGGILQNEVRCLICGMESRKQDPFLDLSLDIPEKFCKELATSTTLSSSNEDNNSKNKNEINPICNIKDCLSSFMEIEELGVTELYYCNSCKCKQKSTKRFWIRRLPNVLCLHIKRFRWNTQRIPYEWSKIDLKISFPLTALDMSPYVLNSGPETRRNSQSSNMYDLGAVIVHHGHGKLANISGHYTSYSINNGTWLHFNDHTVREVLSSEVAECKPYMLFYIRREPSNINNSSSPSPPLSSLRSSPLLNQKTSDIKDNSTTSSSSSDVIDSSSSTANISEKSTGIITKSVKITTNENNNSTFNNTL